MGASPVAAAANGNPELDDLERRRLDVTPVAARLSHPLGCSAVMSRRGTLDPASGQTAPSSYEAARSLRQLHQLPVLYAGQLVEIRRLVLVALATLAIVSGAFFNGYDSLMGKSAAGMVNAAALLAALIHSRPSSSYWRHVRPVLALAGIAFLWAGLVHSGAFDWLGTAPALAPDLVPAEMAGYWAGIAALLAGGIIGLSRRNALLALDIFIFANAALLALSLLAQHTPLGNVLDSWSMARQGRLTGTLGNANVTAAVAAASALLALRGIFPRIAGSEEIGGLVPFPRRIVLIIAFVICLIAIMATASRFTLLVFLLFSAVIIVRWRALGSTAVAMMPLFMALGSVAVAAWFLTPNSHILSSRIGDIGIASGDRMLMWSHYLELALREPLYGYGYGSFSTLNQAMMGSLGNAQALWIVNSPHNVGLQLLLVGGFPYMLLLLAAAVLITKSVLDHASRRRFSIYQICLMAAVATFLACAMVDITLDYPASTYQMLFLLGLLWQPRSTERERGQ